MLTKRRILIVTGIIVLLAILAWLIFGGKKNQTTVTNPTGEFPSQDAPLEFPSQTGSGSGGSSGGSGTLPTSTNAPTGDTVGALTGEQASSTLLLDKQKTPKRFSHGPVAGAIAIGNAKELNLDVRYIEQGTGHVYDFRPIGGAETRVSAATIPRVKEAYFGNKGQSALLRYEDTGGFKNYLIRLPASASASSTQSVQGSYLSGDIFEVAVAPAGDEFTRCPTYLSLTIGATSKPDDIRKLQTFLRDIEKVSSVELTGLYDTATKEAVKAFQTKYSIEPTGNVGPKTLAKINSVYCEKVGGEVAGGKFTYAKRGTNGTEIYISDFDNQKVSKLATIPFTEWRLFWPARTSLALMSRPSAGVDGYAYTLSASIPATPYTIGSLQSLAGPTPGLSLLPSSTKERFLYSQSTGKGMHTFVTTKDGTRDFPLTTLPDKCVWGRGSVVYCAVPNERPVADYPDAWYRGDVKFGDSLYAVDTNTDTVTLLFHSSGNNAPDVKQLFISEDETYLFYLDRNDGYLWGISLGDF